MSEPPTRDTDHPVYGATPGETSLMLGNQATVRGALEAGIAAAATYPGTPSSEIGDTLAEVAPEAGIFFEYSANEKIALEVGAGAALSGARTLVSFKHVGMNVALEALVPLAYTGIRGGLVIVSAGDPGCHSSLTEQDNRHLVRLANLPCIEPATPEEARRWTHRAFEMSEAYELPVILRTTTRISHMKGLVVPQPVPETDSASGFERNPGRFVTIPPVSLERHGVLVEQMERLKDEIAELVAPNPSGGGPLGIVSSGVSRNYVRDALTELGLDQSVDHLELTVTHPLPDRPLARFLEEHDRVLVVEELDPVLEDDVRRILGGDHVAPEARDVEIVGKSAAGLSRIDEYTPQLVKRAVADFADCTIEDENGKCQVSDEVPPIPQRPPALCAGCPHRATYFALKDVAGEDAIYAGDIGCYTLGALPPFQMQDTVLCMGASMGLGSGFAEMNDRPAVSIIGDSTFFHAGLPGLIDALRHGRDLTVAVLDNRTTAMTGHQPHPGSDHGSSGRRLSVESVAEGLGVEKIEVVDPMDLPEITEKSRECVEYPGVAVLVCREACPLYERKAHGPPDEQIVYRVDRDRCKSCGFKSQGLHCGASVCDSTELWRSDRKIQELRVRGEAPPRMEVPPCSASCPVDICAHGYVAYAAGGDYAAAHRAIRERNPLPSVCSHVCHEPCEEACIRSETDEPVAINRIKRFVCDWADEHPDAIEVPEPSRRRDERIAVVGSGPAGLACAHDLALRGYRVVVFDQMSEPGGLLRYGIPPYRLPTEILERDLAWIRDLGVEFRCGVRVGADRSFSSLLDGEFAALCLATGAWSPRIPVDLQDDSARVRDALGFLREVNRGADPSSRREDLEGERLVIVGGGNTGVDASRVARRLGAEDVLLVERTDRERCMAIPEELEAAEAEGVRVRFRTTVDAVENCGDGTQTVRLISADRDESNALRVHADLVLVAVGQRLGPHEDAPPVIDGEWMSADEETQSTAVPGVFAAGDSVAGPGMVIDALAEGKRAAHGIDRYLSAGEREVEPLAFHDPDQYRDQPEYRPVEPTREPRVDPDRREPREAVRDFEPIEWTFDEQQVRAEAERCFACGTCANCNVCIDHFACVALYEGDDGKIRVDESLCNGCGVCAELCPNNAFERVVR